MVVGRIGISVKIHVVQRDGTRYFSRFSDIAERDRLVVELQIEDRNSGTITIDLTEALIREYSKHPEIGRVSAAACESDIVSLQPIKALTAKRARRAAPIDRVDSKTTDILSKVREAQSKAAEEKKQRQAEQAAARAVRLAAAREAKANKRKAQGKAERLAEPKTRPAERKSAAERAAKPKGSAQAAKGRSPVAPQRRRRRNEASEGG